jgi:hypothetical protein
MCSAYAVSFQSSHVSSGQPVASAIVISYSADAARLRCVFRPV